MKGFLALVTQFEPRSRVALVAFAVIAVALEIVSLLLLSGLLLTLLNLQTDALPGALGPLGGILPAASRSLVFLFSAVFAFIVVKNLVLAELWRRALRCLSAEQAKFTLRLFEQYLRMPYPLHLEKSRMTMQHNLNLALNQVFLFLVLPALQISLELLVTLAILVYLLAISPLVTVAIVLWLGATLGLFRAISGKASSDVGKARREALDRMLRIAQESFLDIKSIKIWAREPFFADLFGRAAARQGDFVAKERFLLFAPRFLLEPMLVGALVLFAGVFLLDGAPRTDLLAEISVFAAAAIRILPAANRAIGQGHLLYSQGADLDAIWRDLTLPTDARIDRPDGILAPAFEREILLSDISLRYGPQAVPVLTKTSLDIKRGDRIAIAGTTGVGKTSLLNVLLGLISPDSGAVLIDGKQLHPLLHFRRTSIAFVPQDVAMLDDTIKANITFGSNDDDEDRLWLALKLAQLEAKVRSLPMGWNTVTGENGMKLSGGERQRLALARALYQRPTLLVLDEAMSQLDVHTEAAVLTGIVSHTPDLTLVMVTHRMDNAGIFPRRYLLSDATLVPC